MSGNEVTRQAKFFGSAETNEKVEILGQSPSGLYTYTNMCIRESRVLTCV